MTCSEARSLPGSAWSAPLFLLLLVLAATQLAASEISPQRSLPTGLELLLREPLSFSPLSVQDLDDLWEVWEPEERARAEAATPEERRALTFARYGMVARAGLDDTGLPLGYASDSSGKLYPNCLSCHGGVVAGQVVPGIGNSEQDLTALVADLAALRALRAGGDLEKARSSATLGFPLNFSRGTTNATMYSILLGSMRDEHLEMRLPPQLSQPFVHNTIDAPPWWHFKRKSRIYWDGMAPKTVRTLMQFTMAPGLSGEKIRSWEDEFVAIRTYIASLEPPKYPFDVDSDLATRGRRAFEAVCSRCHGTYGDEPTYPEVEVPIAELGTDPVRLDAIGPESKAKYNQSWFSDYGEHPVKIEVNGYVAPPLDGIWATAPYLHNGSVPTLWHVLHPKERPSVWQRKRNAAAATEYDRERLGLLVEELDAVPATTMNARQRREFYDTSLESQSSAGHLFPSVLSAEQKRAVLEYLKTL